MTYVKDATHAHLLAGTAGKTNQIFFNINSGVTNIGEIIDAVTQLVPGAQIRLGRGITSTARNLPLVMEGGIFDISVA